MRCRHCKYCEVIDWDNAYCSIKHIDADGWSGYSRFPLLSVFYWIKDKIGLWKTKRFFKTGRW